jgi:3-phenylpropionate/trans-cinnamate dioxygenase ferredoxin reductase component
MADDGLVIVGASLAGAKAAEGARNQGWDGPIRVVGAEPHLPYERPPLSKEVLVGREGPTSTLVHDDAFEVTSEVDLLLGAPAVRLDLAARTVELAGGRRLRFAKLVLATGSTPRRLPIPGADLPEVLTLRTVDDCLALRDRLVPGHRLAVVGASWIGTEVTACARQRGCDVVMVDPLSTPLERVLGPEVGGFFAELHAAHGVDVRLGIGVDAFEGSEHVTGVRLSDGAVVDAETVVVGVGVTPNVELARDAGLDVASGVLVDATLTASHPDVLAAGDIAEAHHPVIDQPVRVEHWANALNQGLTAGGNAAGAGRAYDRIPYFFSDQYEMGMEYSGWPLPWDQVVFRGDRSSGAFVAFYLDHGVVTGGANVNVWDVNEQIQNLIRTGKPADLDVLTDPDIDPAAWAPTS